MDGTELYPAAGMIVMAIEAARQIADPTLSITGYRLSDLSFSRALVVSSDPEGVETQLHLRPQKRNTKTTSECSDFVLYVYSKEEWAQVCQGTITTEYARDELDVADVAELDHEQSRLREDFAESARRCKEPVDSKQFYENLAIFGFGFGPTFRGLHQIYYNDTGEATARLSLDDWTTKISSDILKDHVIHPTDLDCVLQLGMAALTRGSWVPTAIMVPAVAKSIWISNNLLTRGRKEEINVCAKTVFKGYREVDFWYAAINTRNEVQILIDGWRITALSKLDAASSAKFAKRRLCYHTAWKPDLEMLGPEQTATYCSASIDSSMLQSKVDVDQLEMVCLQYMSSVLQDPPHSSFEGPRAHLARYVAWIKHHFDERGVDELLSSEFQARKPTTRENNNTFLDNFAKQSAEGALAVAVGKNLNRIFRAELDALDLLFSGTLVQDYYHSSAFSVNYKKIATYVDLLAHKHPDLSILEIGAGTGAATAHIIDTLVSSCDDNSGDESTIPRFSQYTYTDISPAFLEEAKKRFESYSDRMAYRVLDIEKDPLQQDFQPQKYDLVVCSMVSQPLCPGGLNEVLKPLTGSSRDRRLVCDLEECPNAVKTVSHYASVCLYHSV